VIQTGYLLGARAGPPASAMSQDEGWVTRANVSVRPTHDTLVYAQFAEGFRPGGANTAPGLPPQFQTFTSDTLRSHEIGVRSTLGRDWLDIHAAVYRIDWRAMQMMMQIPNFRYVANLGASRIEGVEAEIEARANADVTLRLALSARKGRLTEAIAGVAQPGDRIPFEPEFTASLGGRYTWTAMAGFDGAISLDYAYIGDAASEFSASSPTYERMGDYGSLDAELSFAAPHWRLGLWAANVFDVTGRAHVESSLNAEQFTLGLRPRTFGATLSHRF
jgi:outer membrane receptor protein involved in Fe transport